MAKRNANRALVYLRRSTEKQEASLEPQLRWAIEKAHVLGLHLDASVEMLNRMSSTRVSTLGDMYLDDGITGADLSRPGFNLFRERALRDSSVSHLLVHYTDRFARPEMAADAVRLEQELRLAGITLVYSDRIAEPLKRGENNLADTLTSLVTFSESGDYLRKLACRISAVKISLALGGYWTGGRPPYGFVRILVGRDGTEIQELADGEHIRREGCHVRIRPKDPEKLAVWIQILKWYGSEKKGAKWIASELNHRGIPSPDAGRTRTDRAGVHRVSGKWSHRTVSALIRNPAIAGVLRYGTKSEGAHRRLGVDGVRLLDDHDLSANGKPRAIKNPREAHIERPGGFEPLVAPELFEACQAQDGARGRSQRGVPRSRDASRHPLALLVFDLSDGCGCPMYACKSGSRRLYKCGRYIKTNGGECQHNAVDAEALLAFVLQFLRLATALPGGRSALERRIRELAEAEHASKPDTQRLEHERLVRDVAALEEELRIVDKNLARARSNDEYGAIARERVELVSRLDKARRSFKEHSVALSSSNAFDPDREVSKALDLFDNIERIVGDPSARAELPALLRQLGVKIGLDFCESRKGKRAIRKLRRGMIVTGDRQLPVPPYGKNAVRRDTMSSSDGMVPSRKLLDPDAEYTSGAREGVSFNLGNRGD